MNEAEGYEFSHIREAKGVVHRVFSRRGGASKEPYDSLNVGKNNGDDPLAVRENRQRILKSLGMKKAVYLNQVHGSDILVLKNGDPADKDLKTGLTADGVVTDIPGLALVIQVADCQAVLLYDPENRVIANVHSGWRGSIQNIIGRCVDLMAGEFGSDPGKLLAGISPSLGPCCAEFIHYKDEIPKPLWKYKIPGRNYFDFWTLSREQLMEKGILETRIENMALCTRCRTDRFFSYRAHPVTGRFACAAALI
ncbi:peptidoglycan editing factor PgeF [Desulfospira joergensenii]|uniref:peptidoglycan editing factor PgeF n=1 Tax=Desulfospira joergensenii TaxID=53329 RepID=UPI0003B426FC|nr:peptidoglycan editing factor PgeF [Desulfospira joergensenii]